MDVKALAAEVQGRLRAAADPGRRDFTKGYFPSAMRIQGVATPDKKSHGGSGDAERTLMIGALVASDHDDMVAKGLSWALRELIVRDRAAVRRFLTEHEPALAARVRREVRNKLRTGLKNPRRTNT